MADGDSADPAFDSSQQEEKETQNSGQTNKNRKKRNKKKKKTSIVSNYGDGIAANQIFGDISIQQIQITESSSKKDLIPILQKDLRRKYLEKSYLQNIPGLTEDRFIDNHYVNLKLIQRFEEENQSKETNLEEMFQSLKKTENDSKSGIHFEGELGYGKTTLMWKIARDWANQETYLSDFDLLFVIPLRDLEYSKTVNSYIKEQWFSKFETDKIWDEFKLKRVLMLFDGFDELQENNRDKILKDIKECKEKQNFLVVITSRSGNSLPKLKEMISDFQKVSIKGFPDDGVNHFLKQFLGKEMGQKVFNRIEDAMKKNHFVSELRCNPLFLTFFCIIIKSDRHYSLPNTYTELITDFISSLLQRHIEKKIEKPIDINKINLLDKDENPPLVINFIEELEHFGEYTFKKLISNNIGIWISSKEIQDNCLNSALEIGLIIQSCRIRNRSDIYEPIHLFILEFLRSYYLFCLFQNNRKEFFQKFQQLLLNINSYFEIGFMVSFIFGLLGKHLVDVIQEIPSKLFFSVSSSVIGYMQTENPDHFKDVLSFLESMSNFDVSFDINISNQSPKPNFNVIPEPKIRPLIGFVEVHHGEKTANPNSIILSEFLESHYETISVNFHCIKGKTCHSEECCVSEVCESLKGLLEMKPQSITIRSHCHFTGNSMINFLSENSHEFESLTLNSTTQESLNMEPVSNLVLNSKTKKLICNSGKIVDTKNNFEPNISLLKCVLHPTSELKQLGFIDVDLQIDFKHLLRAVKRSKLLAFSLQYSSFKDNISIDMSQLLRKQSHWLNINLKNVHVIARYLDVCHISELCLCNCKIRKKHLKQLLKKGSVQIFKVDTTLYKQRQNILLTFQHLVIEVICQMKDDWDSKENKTKLVCTLKDIFFLRGNYRLYFVMNFKSNIYLQQITTIAECIQSVLNNFQQPNKILIKLNILRSTEQRKIEMEEINLLTEVIAKLVNASERFFNCYFSIYTELENKGHEELLTFKLQQQLSKYLYF